MNVNLSDRELLETKNQVISGDPTCDWTLFTYAQGRNDLKVQATGDGGLEELADEFKDGRIQYAFVRVMDSNSELPKFIQINWCGDGVPENKKGLFHTHSTAVARFLKEAHIQVNARNEADVDPAHIRKRLADAGGAKYSVHKEAPRAPEKIAAVGSSYQPIKVDMNALKAGETKPALTSSGSAYRQQAVKTALPGLGSKPAAAPAKRWTPPTTSVPSKNDDESWGDDEPSATASSASHIHPSAAPRAVEYGADRFKSATPVAQPAASAPKSDINDDETWGDEPPPVGATVVPRFGAAGANAPKSFGSPAATPAYKAPPPRAEPAAPAATASSKPAPEERIGPVGTAYTPVSLPAPKKLANRWGAGAVLQESASSSPAASSKPVLNRWGSGATSSTPGAAAGPAPTEGKKLTWSERQALAKARDAEEEQRSKAATASNLGATAGDAAISSRRSPSPEPAPAPTPAPAAAAAAAPPPPARPPQPDSDDEQPEEDDWSEDPPVPAPAAALPPRINLASRPPPAPAVTADDDEGFEEPEPTPAPAARSVPKPPVVNSAPAFPDDDDFGDDDEEAPEVPPPPPPPPAPAAEPTTVVEQVKEAVTSAVAAVKEAVVGGDAGGQHGKRARVLFDYEKTEDNEVNLREGEILTEVEEIDEGWWKAVNEKGEEGLFPANYVEKIEGNDDTAASAPHEEVEEEEAPPPPPPAPPAPEPEAAPVEASTASGEIAIALYDYDAAEGNELTFKEGDNIVSIERVSEEWWSGTGPDGAEGLFPANYVEPQQ